MSIPNPTKKINIVVLVAICVVLGTMFAAGSLKLVGFSRAKEQIRVVPPTLDITSQNATVTESKSPIGQVVASKTGTKYHLPDCPGAKAISPANKIVFNSAIAAGKGRVYSSCQLPRSQNTMIILDVETTGTNRAKNSLVSIGAVDFNNPKDQFYQECQIWGGARIEREALMVNGFTEDQIRDPKKSDEAEIVRAFFAWVAGRENQVVVGQNPMFDLGFLQSAADRAGIEYPLARRSLDVHSLAFMHMVQRGINPPIKNKKSDMHSDSIMAYVGIPAEPKPHKAINGAVWEAEAFSRLLFGRKLLPQFDQYPIPWL